MSFLPLKPCCITSPGELPGTPRGQMEAGGEGRVSRYITKPEGEVGVQDSKAVLILLYDLIGFKAVNPKILADAFATKLGITVIVPDYIPNAPDPIWFKSVFKTYPGQFADKSWIDTIWDWGVVFSKLVWKIPGLLTGSTLPLVQAAVKQAQEEGYERIGAIGYCRGGSMVHHLLFPGPNSPLTCGVICHPGPEGAYEKITKPTMWVLAEQDDIFKPKDIAALRQGMEGRDVVFEHTIYEETVHGFAARPNLEHEPTVKAFEAANTASVAFLKKHLGL